LYERAAARPDRILWLDRAGRTSPLHPEAGEYPSVLEFSPDGQRIAMVAVDGGNSDVWVYDRQRNVGTRVTFAPGLDTFPHWAPDGRHILFSSVRHGGAQNLYWMRADGGGEAARITESSAVHFAGSIAPDTRRIAYTAVDPESGYDLWTVAIEGGDTDRPRAGTPEPFLRTRFNELSPAISPDGKWVAYTSNETGRSEVFVQRFPGGGGKTRISTDGARDAAWSKRGRQLFYWSAEGIAAVDYAAAGETFTPGKPRVWAAHDRVRVFAIAPDEQGAAIVTGAAAQAAETVFVLGFFDELRRRTPGR
jgi:Tol biopolymer transport system component